MMLMGMVRLFSFNIVGEQDAYSSFGWIKYVEHSRLEADNIKELMNKANAYRFGEYFLWNYALGIFDYTADNCMIEKSGGLFARYDVETAFAPIHSLGFDKYFKGMIGDLANPAKFPPLFAASIRENFDSFSKGVLFAAQYFSAQEGSLGLAELLLSRLGKLVELKRRSRVVLRSTRDYQNDPRLQGVSPYYSFQMDQSTLMSFSSTMRNLQDGFFK